MRALVVVVCGFAHAQQPAATAPDPLARMVAADARPLLAHDDPVVRGEAALVLAHANDPAARDAVVAMASDDEPAARQRALVALGVLGTPAAVQLLGDRLADTGARAEPDGVAAAFGLGLAPCESSASVTTRVLAAIAQGSWKRQRDTLLALLLAMATRPDRTETLALRQLLDDESNRDPDVRALLLQLLLPLDRTLDGKTLRRIVERGSEPERLAVLQSIGCHGEVEAEWLPLLERLATQAQRAEVRSEALAALTRARHLPALDLAARTLRQGTPAECAQALRSLLAIGGARMLRAAAPEIERERDPARKAAMLASFAAPLPPFLADHCAKLAIDTAQSWPLRDAAALALAEDDPERAAPMLRDLFRATTDDAALPALARALRRAHETPADVARLVDGGTDLHEHPVRWVALLAAEHPDARRQLVQSLRAAGAPAPRLAIALRVWRAATVLAVPVRDGAVPAAVHTLLAIER